MRILNKYVIMAMILGLFISLAVSYGNYRTLKINHLEKAGFIKNLQAAVSQNSQLDLKETTDFEWDTLYMFPPYLSKAEMEKTVGVKWSAEPTYFNYLSHQLTGEEFPLLDDSLHKLVFVRGDDVVLDVTLDRMLVDFTSTTRKVSRHEAVYEIIRTDEGLYQLKNTEVK
ncbi:hypothetical protein [Paenibacillus luteus]|uniref:hypothetical protein n=1 Tax=Paenibacillus luteus TaxID=2545753 RepID=UPI0011448300|nr:hypothetical protein [Paenibacillus luteus]